MKKISLLLLSVLAVRAAVACDICGCASASGALFPGTINRQSQFSLGYHYLNFTSKHLPSILQGQQGVERSSQEQFQLLSFGARYSFHPKWQAVLQLPAQFVQKKDAGVTTQTQGLGDMQLGIARYFSGDSLGVFDSWTLMAEYDIKLPSGQFDGGSISEQTSRYMLPGSGSVDHFFRVHGQSTIKNWMFSLGALYRLNGNGPNNLNWGNRSQVYGEIGKLFFTKSMHQWYTSIGYAYEHASADYQHGQELPFSTYGIGQMKGSVQWRKNQWAAAGMYFLPIHGSMADGRVQIKQRFQVQITFYPKF